MKNEFTHEHITELQAGEIFVFGSNLNGRHAGGAALVALECFGAVDGQAEGPQGQSYAIPTLSKKMQKLSLSTIKKSIARFMKHAEANPDQRFYVTKIGCGIAGFEISQIAPLFGAAPDNVILPKEFTAGPQIIRGWKGFDYNLACRGFQYEIGKTSEVDSVRLCYHGLHFCENPHDIFGYYAPGDGNRFCEIEAEDVSNKRGDDSKRVAKKVTVKAEVSAFDICEIAVPTFFENFGFENKVAAANTNNAGYQGAASAGDWGAASAGYQGAASAGYQGAASAGYQGAARAGDRGAANAGNQGVARAGDRGAARAGEQGAASAGDRGAARAGDRGVARAGDRGAARAGEQGAASAGDRGTASVGRDGIAIASTAGRVRGKTGAILVLVNRNDDGSIREYSVAHVDGVHIKEDVWYELKNCRFSEIEEEL